VDEAPTARRFAVRFVVLLAGLTLAGTLVFLLLRPPRLVWGSWFMAPTVPRGSRGYAVYGATWLEDLRLRLSGNSIVYIPDHRPGTEAWPRLTGRRRPVVANQGGEEEIELSPR